MYKKKKYINSLTLTTDDEESEVSRVVFRRLSQTTQTDALLGNLDVSSARGKLIIRPKTVQVRHLVIIKFSDPSLSISVCMYVCMYVWFIFVPGVEGRDGWR